MKRERLAWAVSLMLVTLVAFRTSRSMATHDDDYTFVRTLIDIHHQVSSNYVEPVDETKLQQAAIDGMLGQLDPFTNYIPPAKKEDFDRMLEGTFKGVGIQLDQLENGNIEVVTPIEGSPAFRAGVMAGDVILKVNGDQTAGLKLADVIKKITGELGSEVKLNVKHPTGEEAEIVMKREEIVLPTVKGYSRKQDNTWNYFVSAKPKVGYLRITQFTPTTYDQVKEAMTAMLKDGMQGFILDLRFNPGGQLDQAVKIVNLFVPEGTIVVTKGRNRPEDIKKATKEGALPSTFPMIVLVNEHSASASEIVAGSLMDNKRAVVVGQRSYGKGSVQELIPLDGNNGELKMTVAYYYLPSGRLVHKKKDAKDWGVEPQIVVPMDEEQEKRMLKDRYEQDLFHRAGTQPSTKPVASTQPIDPQLTRAVDAMLATLIFQNQGVPTTGPVQVLIPATQPATKKAE